MVLSVCFVVVYGLCGMVRSEVGCVSSVPSRSRVPCTRAMVVDIVYLDGLSLNLEHCTTWKMQDDVDWDGCSEDLLWCILNRGKLVWFGSFGCWFDVCMFVHVYV